MNAHRLARVAWSEEGGAAASALSAALLPLSALFRFGARVHHGLYDAGVRAVARAPIPVISVGNLRVGGSGKTPFARWIVERLLEAGHRPALLHGGYGMDEPALHRRWHPDVPVLAGRDRLAGARAAMARGCDVAVLDDGFQHRRLARDLDIVLLAAEHGARRVRLLPRGPWREPLAALRRADLVVVTRKTATREQANELALTIRNVPERRAAHASILPDAWSDLEGADVPPPSGTVVAVASIAEPESFFRTVERLGLTVAERVEFRDHHEYDAADVSRIGALAGGRTIVTTEKDAVKLAALRPSWAPRACALGQRLVVDDGEAELVARILEAAGR